MPYSARIGKGGSAHAMSNPAIFVDETDCCKLGALRNKYSAAAHQDEGFVDL